MRRLQDKRALVTGASRGIGKDIAELFAAEGGKVVCAARTLKEGDHPLEGSLEHTVNGIREQGGEATPVAVNISEYDECVRLFDETHKAYGPVDVLVNNAALDHYRAFRTKPVEEMRAEIETNLLAPLHLTRLLLEGMLARETGHIVNIASMAAKIGIAYEATYSATKAGLLEWANALRAELHGTGVGVSVVLPTVIGDVGVFSRQGVRPPRLAAPVPSTRVARAVLRAIRDNVPEIIVTPWPSRPLLALDTLFPAFGNWMFRRTGVTRMMEELAAGAAAASSAEGASPEQAPHEGETY
jgi:citronellol/citronellal dehydrogenase